MDAEKRMVTRDCPATAIPYGDRVVIPAGSEVMITHRLGGHFTVTWDYGMARITGENADAIGEASTTVSTTTATESKQPTDTPPDEQAIWEQLKMVYDPEIPVNIVDLGLVYSMAIEESQPKRYCAIVKMTLTAPGCGMGPYIAEDAKNRLLQLPNIAEAQVDIVWDPPWNQDMISEEGKMHLGLI